MTTHSPQLSTGEIYHIYNRTIGKENVFTSTRNASKFIEITNYYRYNQSFRLSKFLSLPYQAQQEILMSRKNKKPIVELFAFAFMPNHFHFLIRQLENKGISHFASNIQNSFAKYYNLKTDRVGGLFQCSFKAKRIQTTEEFIHVSRYIHLNPVTSGFISFEQLRDHPWTSFSWYIDQNKNIFISRDYILNHFKRIERFERFVRNQVNYQRTLRKIKKLLLD
jgi:putative transposase